MGSSELVPHQAAPGQVEGLEAGRGVQEAEGEEIGCKIGSVAKHLLPPSWGLAPFHSSLWKTPNYSPTHPPPNQFQ